MNKKIAINFFYNAAYQILLLIIPVITIPYVSRIFNAEQLGIVGFTSSLTSFFVIFGGFGVTAYGTKKIAEVLAQKNERKIKEQFLQIYSVQATVTLGMLIIFSISLIFFDIAKYAIYFIPQTFLLLDRLFDISWYYFAKEDFKKTVVRNIVVKIMAVIAIFIFVKSSQDLVVYILITAIGLFLGNIVLFSTLKKEIDFNFLELIQSAKDGFNNHIRPMFLLFVPSLFIYVYTTFDRTLLGMTASIDDVGLYDQSMKLVRISIGLLSALSLVMLPHITKMIQSKNKELQKQLSKSLEITIVFGVAITFGLVAIANNLVPWFYGEQYLQVTQLLQSGAPLALLISLSNLYINQIAIPFGKNNVNMINGVVAVLVLVLIPSMGYYLEAIGAILALTIAEGIGLAMRMYLSRDIIRIRIVAKFILTYSLAGVAMLVIVNYLSLTPSIINTGILAIMGGCIYLVLAYAVHKLIHLKESC